MTIPFSVSHLQRGVLAQGRDHRPHRGGAHRELQGEPRPIRVRIQDPDRLEQEGPE